MHEEMAEIAENGLPSSWRQFKYRELLRCHVVRACVSDEEGPGSVADGVCYSTGESRQAMSE